MSAEPSTHYSEVVCRGALAGAITACDGRTRQAQVQRLLEIAGAYGSVEEAMNVLMLYIAYQVGRGTIARESGYRIVNDILWLKSRFTGNALNEALRKYLGSLKWSYTAVDKLLSDIARLVRERKHKSSKNVREAIHKACERLTNIDNLSKLIELVLNPTILLESTSNK